MQTADSLALEFLGIADLTARARKIDSMIGAVYLTWTGAYRVEGFAPEKLRAAGFRPPRLRDFAGTAEKAESARVRILEALLSDGMPDSLDHIRYRAASAFSNACYQDGGTAASMARAGLAAALRFLAESGTLTGHQAARISAATA